MIYGLVVPKEGVEPTHPCGYYVLNVARLPFRHFGISVNFTWWAVEDLNLGPLACEASALTTELTAPSNYMTKNVSVLVP